MRRHKILKPAGPKSGTRSAISVGVDVRITLVPALVMSALVGACAPSSSDSVHGPLEGKLSNNGLVLDLTTLDDLSTLPLADEAAFAPLLATENGRELFSYAVTCALGEGQDHLGYSGNLGLAQEWLDSTCDLTCQRWVSACILAHTNAFGDSVEMSPRGSHPSFGWNEEIENVFSYEEAAFYGNLFLPEEERHATVCAGDGLFEIPGDNGDQSSVVAGRIHQTGSTRFGLGYSGSCNSLTPEVPAGIYDSAACDSKIGGFYQGCLEAEDPSFYDWTATPGPRFMEVVTVFLRPT